EILGGEVVEVVVLGELLGLRAHCLAREGAYRATEVRGAPDAVAPPERHRTGCAGRRGDDHPVAGDLLDPPGRSAEQEGLPWAGLVDHLLIELADPAPVREVDAVEAAVGNRARVCDREL